MRREGYRVVLGNRARGFSAYRVTAMEEWNADGTFCVRFVGPVDGPDPHAAWLRPGDPTEHATAISGDRTLCDLTDGQVHRHLFEGVRMERRCSECQEAVERETAE